MYKKIFLVGIVWIIGMMTGLMTVRAADHRFTLVIDAGHGGKDPGAKGKISNEKDINLSVALAFGQYVERNCPDVKVIYTRKTDVFIQLEERANIANRNKADLFISVHTNALEGGRISRGLETYTLGMHRAADNLNVAKRENSVILLEKNYKQTYAGFDPKSAESYIMFELMQDKYMANSVEMAKLIQSETCATSGRVDKGVHQAGFLVIRETSMPSCLIELGFITTPDEEEFLNTKEGQDKMARGIYNAFVKYKKKYGAKVTGQNNYPDPPLLLEEEKPSQVFMEDHANSSSDTEYAQAIPVRVQTPTPAPVPQQEAPKPAPQPAKTQPTPQPAKTQPTPQPAKTQPTPQPEKTQTTPQPEKPKPTPQPEKTQTTPQPEKPKPTPQPEKTQPTPQPEKPKPAPQPEKTQPTPQPEKPKPTPQPEKTQPTPQPEKPNNPTTSQPEKPAQPEKPNNLTTSQPEKPTVEEVAPVPEDMQPGGRPIFKVQIAATSMQLPLDAPQFMGVKGVEMYAENGMYKYTIGASPDFDEVNRLRKTVLDTFPQAFIIAFRDGYKMNISEAVREFRKNKAAQKTNHQAQ